MPNVFISYAHENSGVADQIAAILTGLGIDFFRDVKDIGWGDAITPVVRAALVESDAILVIVSPASRDSQWVPFEIGHASAYQKRVLPFMTDESMSLPLFMRDLRSVTSMEQVSTYFSDPSWADTDPDAPIAADGRFTQHGIAAAMELVLAEAKVPMFFASSSLDRIMACNQPIADLLGTAQEKIKEEPAAWLVDRLISLAPAESQREFRKHQKEMAERFLDGITDYDYEDEHVDCRQHPASNPLRGEWRIRIHAHRVRDGDRQFGFFVYYTLDEVASSE